MLGLNGIVCECITDCDCLSNKINKWKRLELIVEDFAENGTRHDTNPTGQFMECGCFNSFKGDHWQSYIKSQDKYVREKAREALVKKE